VFPTRDHRAAPTMPGIGARVWSADSTIVSNQQDPDMLER